MAFRIHQPNGVNYNLYYDKDITTEEKFELLEKTILSHWDDYINDKWFWGGKFDLYHRNHEDKVKYMLERCADFILQGELNHEGMLITNKKEKRINMFEVPNTSCGTEAKDLFYSSSNDASITYESLYSIVNQKQLESIEKTNREKNSKKVKEYKKTYRETNKKIKNIEKEINFNDYYISEWVPVDTHNSFCFNEKKFEIDGHVESYMGKLQKDGSVFYPQDKILCYYQDKEYKFFDMGYNKINDIYVVGHKDHKY